MKNKLLIFLLLLVPVPVLAQYQTFFILNTTPVIPCPPCEDAFVGPTNQLLTVHNPLWADVNTSYLASCGMLTGGPGVTAQHGCMLDVAGGVYTTSVSDTSQVILQSNSETTNFPIVCARCGSGTLGYEVGDRKSK